MKRAVLTKTGGLVLGMLMAAAAGCSAEVGDSCETNLECSTAGDRICDLTQKDGYCTVAGCDWGSCPEEAVCVGFFPVAFLSTPCDPLTEDAVNMEPDVATNDCLRSETCLSNGFCAPSTSEQRFCMKTCESDDDCRSGYECRTTGTKGSQAVPDPENPGIQNFKFCAQRL